MLNGRQNSFCFIAVNLQKTFKTQRVLKYLPDEYKRAEGYERIPQRRIQSPQVEEPIQTEPIEALRRTELGLPLEEINKELAKQRQSKAGELFGKGKDSLGSNEQELSQGKARDITAKTIGVSATTYHRAKTILQKGSEKL